MYLEDLSRASFALFPLPLSFPGLAPRLAPYPHPTPSCLRAFITWTSDLSKALTVPVWQKSICEEWDQPKAPSSPKPPPSICPKGATQLNISSVPKPGQGSVFFLVGKEKEGGREQRRGGERSGGGRRLAPAPRCLFCCF